MRWGREQLATAAGAAVDSSSSSGNRSAASGTSKLVTLDHTGSLLRCQLARLLTLLCRLLRGMFSTSDLAGTHYAQDCCLAERMSKQLSRA